MFDNAKQCTCGNVCRPLYTNANPKASEWYCSKCNKSYPMIEREIEMFMNAAKQQQPVTQRRG